MNIQNYQLNTELTLHNSNQTSLIVKATTLTIKKLDNTLVESRLTFQFPPELYQQIDSQALFNLQPELRGSVWNGEFDSETNIEIIASLKPDLLPLLSPHFNNAPAELHQLSQSEPNHPLFNTENWLALQVKQPRLPVETGYRTFWDYLNLSVINNQISESENLNDAIINFFQDWTENNLQSMTDVTITQSLNEITKGLQEWIDSSISARDEETIYQKVESVVQGFKELANTSYDHEDIFQILVTFFIEDDWAFIKIQGEPILRLAYQGKNGTWNCYAKVCSEQQIVFYSIYPTLVPENKLLSVAEFINRVNCNLVIGNFELDFDLREFRYKTSFDGSVAIPTFRIINNLVYTNISIMDKYLPGIISVIDSDALAKDAINQIKNIPNYTESSSLIDDDMTLTDVLERAENVQNYLQSSNVDEQQLSLFSIDEQEKITNDQHPLTLVTLVDNQEEKCEKRFHILSRLTPSEIAQFHAVSQMQKPYQLKQAQAFIEELQNEMIRSHDSDGEELFLQANTFFKESTLDTRIIKLIQRYSGLAGQARLFLQHLKAGSEQYGEAPVNSQAQIAIVELGKLFWSIEERLQQLATGELAAKQEVKLLIEIEDFREQLAVFEQIINTYR